MKESNARTQSADTSSPLVGEPTFTVLVNFEQVGWHCWPQAPSEVEYLRNDHRHLFKFRVELRVPHGDRSIEVHQLKASCQRWAALVFAGTKTWSCEKFSHLLLEQLRRQWQPAWGKVECWEDGECGGGCEMSWVEEKQ